LFIDVSENLLLKTYMHIATTARSRFWSCGNCNYDPSAKCGRTPLRSMGNDRTRQL